MLKEKQEQNVSIKDFNMPFSSMVILALCLVDNIVANEPSSTRYSPDKNTFPGADTSVFIN